MRVPVHSWRKARTRDSSAAAATGSTIRQAFPSRTMRILPSARSMATAPMSSGSIGTSLRSRRPSTGVASRRAMSADTVKIESPPARRA
jgi:hypothetical protein